MRAEPLPQLGVRQLKIIHLSRAQIRANPWKLPKEDSCAFPSKVDGAQAEEHKVDCLSRYY